jgi:ATP-dependent exoDNAse (exonuclease V) beta subunit
LTDVTLYGGRVRLTFDEAAHSYAVSVDGGAPELVPSVTSILKVIDKPALPRWAAKETAEYVGRTLKPGVMLDEIAIKNLVRDAKRAPWDKAEEAADIGSLVHRFAEDFALGKDPALPVEARARRAVDQFLGWWNANHVEVIAAERKVYSEEFRFAGTVDLVARVNGRLAVVDYKTSTGIWPEYRLQLAAYASAWGEEQDENIVDRWCLRFGKDGAFEAASYPWWEGAGFRAAQTDLDAFAAALSLYRWQESIKKRSAA